MNIQTTNTPNYSIYPTNLSKPTVTRIAVFAACSAIAGFLDYNQLAPRTVTCAIAAGGALTSLLGFFDTQREPSNESTEELNKQRSSIKRPSKIQKAIDECFTNLVNRESQWTRNGEERYPMLRSNQCAMIENIIRTASKDQKDFYILDLGAGKFQWGRKIEEFLKEQQNLLASDQKVHIISVRGEKKNETTVFEEGQIKRYELGAFKIEDLDSALKNAPETKELNLKNNVDFVVSSYTFRHLVDPVGTFSQTYNLIKPRQGLFLFDGFFCLDESDTKLINNNAANERLINLLQATGSSVAFSGDSGDLLEVLLKRSSEQEFPFDLKYADLLSSGDSRNDVNTKSIARLCNLPLLQNATDNQMHVRTKDITQYYGCYPIQGNRDLASLLLGTHELSSFPANS